MHPAPHTGSIVDRGADANPSGSQPAHGPFATGHGRAGGNGSSGPLSWELPQPEGKTLVVNKKHIKVRGVQIGQNDSHHRATTLISGTPADQVCHMYRYDPLHAFSARLSLLYDRQLEVLRLVLFAQQGDQQDISLAMLDRQYETKTVELKTVRADGGGKFSSRDFHNLFKKKGRRRQLTSAYSSFGIGVAEERR
ncbi:hypothetical protein GN244_ATG03069 [Phytophthora infestans]|uniref:Uncharacterized protein n=1 Tax=Phytophthora infestans TaxID=4787 RepID=A0A833WNX7_PHYIN|nr:hypothetical protein GN244_ATG03069 [Phytophthora infestans]